MVSAPPGLLLLQDSKNGDYCCVVSGHFSVDAPGCCSAVPARYSRFFPPGFQPLHSAGWYFRWDADSSGRPWLLFDGDSSSPLLVQGTDMTPRSGIACSVLDAPSGSLLQDYSSVPAVAPGSLLQDCCFPFYWVISCFPLLIAECCGCLDS